MRKGEFDKKYPVVSVGTNNFVHYHLYGQDFWLGPTPNAATTVTVEGYYYPAELVDGTSTNVFTELASGLTVAGLCDEIVTWSYEDDVRPDTFERRFRAKMFAISREGKRRHDLARRADGRRYGG